MAHYLDPKNDLTFKRVFGEPTVEVPGELLENEYIREAVGYMERSAYTKEQLDAYYQWKIDTMTSRSMIDNAEARGEARGLERGEARGLEKAVLNSHRAGYSVEAISIITGLTHEEIIHILERETM